MRILLLPILLLLPSGDLGDLLEKIGRESDPVARRALVARLSSHHTARSVGALDKLARHDPDVSVRVGAIRGIAGAKVETARETLGGLLVDGGVRQVRRAVAEGLVARGVGEKEMAPWIANPKTDVLARGLFVEALGVVPGPEALHRLRSLAAGPDVHLRGEALRALAIRKDGRDGLVDLLEIVLGKYRDAGTVMSILDLIEDRPAVRLLPAVERLATFLEPAVRQAAEHARDVLKFEKADAEAKAAAAAAAKEGYEFAPPGRPEPPPPRPRFDMVYGFDSTGSVNVHREAIVKRIRAEVRFLADLGSDVRIGVVVFRDQRTMREYPMLQVLPLTHDLAAVERYLGEVRAGGADSQGAAVSVGLDAGLNRMGWRPRARRTFTLIADSKLDDPARCRRIVKIHRHADGTRIKVLYLLRTRRKIPDDVRALAEAGGSTLEVLE